MRMIGGRSLNELVSMAFSAPFIALYLLIRLVVDDSIGIMGLILGLLWLVAIPLTVPLYYAWAYGIEWDYPDRRHRIIPFLLIVIGYLFLVALSILLLRRTMQFISLSYLINGLFAWATSLRYKISIHMIGISGPATAILLLGYDVDAAILYTAGIITAYSRMTLKRHTPGQIITGFLSGIILTVLAYVLVYEH